MHDVQLLGAQVHAGSLGPVSVCSIKTAFRRSTNANSEWRDRKWSALHWTRNPGSAAPLLEFVVMMRAAMHQHDARHDAAT